MNSRRNFIKQSSALVALAGIPLNQLQENMPEEKNENRPKVLFFDVNETLLDLTAMRKNVAKALNNREDLLPLWFTSMLQYSLVMTSARQYQDFGIIGAAALQMVAANQGITISAEEAKQAIVGPLRSLPPHPEVKSALAKLKKAGFKLVSFTNSSNMGVKTQFTNAQLLDYFDERLSVEDIGKYKPHADTYDWAARKMAVHPKDCMLIAAHGWDIAGAIWANWRTAFISRTGAQLFPLAPLPELQETNLDKIADHLIKLK